MNRDSAETILVLDGESRAALAVVRSLGKRGKRLVVASFEKKGLAGHSKYAHKHIACPSADEDPEAFCSWLRTTLQEETFSHLLPITDTSLRLALSIEEEIRKLTTLPFVSAEVFAAVSNKDKLLAEASRLGLRCPQSISLMQRREQSEEQLQQIRAFSYPAVAKPVQSSEHQGEKRIASEIRYFDSAQDAIAFFSQQETEEGVRYLLQERIQGRGLGVFAVCAEGKAVQFFAHRRILEKPPSGGRSVLSESLPLEQAPVEQARALLEHYRWDGVAMVEFKQDNDGDSYLMEINPRFWGSLQLAIDAGRDFPAMLLQIFPSGAEADRDAIDSIRASEQPFAHGCRLRWTLGCLDHFLIRLKQDVCSTLSDTLLRNALHFFVRSGDSVGVKVRTRLEVLRLDDPRPFLVELRQYALQLLRIA